MFVICEYAACLLAALVSGTLLFTVGVMGVLLIEAGGIARRRWPELAHRAEGWAGRWAADKPREP